MHVAHNAVVGRNCLVAAQSGIAGSASLGDRVLVGGQVGMFVHGLHVRARACSACMYVHALHLHTWHDVRATVPSVLYVATKQTMVSSSC